MSIQVARLTDKHQGICDHGLPCCPHNVEGVISTASTTVECDGLGIARLGDAVIHDCPHCGVGKITTATATEFSDGKPIARLGDVVTYPAGTGKIITSSQTTDVS